MRRTSSTVLGAVGAFALAGCGAAYYGSALAVVATQKDKSMIDTSFPDAVPTADQVPTFATLRLSSGQVTLDRPDGAGGNAPATDFELLAVDFPAGYGEAISNRDAGTTLLADDRLVIRVNGDASREVTFEAADVANVGTAVAARIQAKVRALTPASTEVPDAAYSLFTASYQPSLGAYTFRSGAPGEASGVAFQTAPRSGTADVTPDANSQATARRLGLGVAEGGAERTGGESVRVTVLNRGTDVIAAGTPIELYLSQDKVLDRQADVHFGRIVTDAPVEVGQARRFTRQNGPPPRRLLRQDVPSGLYYVIFDVQPSGGERVVDNNTLVARKPVVIHQPAIDPAEAGTDPDPAALDFVIEATASPIALVTGNVFASDVTITNLGAEVATAAGIDIDLVLSADEVFDAPGGFHDPDALLAGVRVNPTDPNRPITVQVVEHTGGGSVPPTRLFGDTVTVSYLAGTATVQSLTDALNAAPNGVLDAFADGVGAPASDSLAALLGAAGADSTVAKDIFLATRQVSFAPVDRPLQQRSFAVSGTLRETALLPALLPLKLFPAYRIRPPASFAGAPENTRNNTRRAANFVRIYNRASAHFDATTGVYLPTVGAQDFAAFEAVTQRPVNTGSIRQGQQRTFSFEIPNTTQDFEESQLLIALQTDRFDAHLDLFSTAGEFVTGSDDSALGTSPIIYTPVFASNASRTFYLVVSSARFDESDVAGEGEVFDLTINVHSRRQGDAALINAVRVGNVLDAVKTRTPDGSAARLENDVLVPFSLQSSSAEVLFVLPQRARVRLRSRPVPTIAVETVITQFVQDTVPSPVEHQAGLDSTFSRVVYRPSGGSTTTSHVLERGIYTFTVTRVGGDPDPQPFRLEIDTTFIPPQ